MADQGGELRERARHAFGAKGISVEPTAKRIRGVFAGRTVADSLGVLLMREAGKFAPVHYFPREDVRTNLLVRSGRTERCPVRGEAVYFTLRDGGASADDAAWSYEDPAPEFAPIKDRIAFDWRKLDHWFEEDEEIFGHPRDPYHRIDVRPSSRKVRVLFGGEVLARSGRALFLFETGMPTRYYIPPEDVEFEWLAPSATTSICPYKGTASYWSVRLGDRAADDIAWSYEEPLPECPRIAGHVCFYPEKVDAIEVEGGA